MGVGRHGSTPMFSDGAEGDFHGFFAAVDLRQGLTVCSIAPELLPGVFFVVKRFVMALLDVVVVFVLVVVVVCGDDIESTA